MLRTIEQTQDFGIDPDIWKIEGIDSSEACAEIAALVKRDGRDHVGCVVLGRGADDAAVETWLRAGAKIPGYLGFAIGRSIFNESVKGVASGTMERDAATALISRKYRHFIDVYEGRA
jgi:myo-inositol catabolism protein IolC